MQLPHPKCICHQRAPDTKLSFHIGTIRKCGVLYPAQEGLLQLPANLRSRSNKTFLMFDQHEFPRFGEPGWVQIMSGKSKTKLRTVQNGLFCVAVRTNPRTEPLCSPSPHRFSLTAGSSAVFVAFELLNLRDDRHELGLKTNLTERKA